MTTTETYGPYGGRYVPETLIPALDELTAAWAEDARARNCIRLCTRLNQTRIVF